MKDISVIGQIPDQIGTYDDEGNELTPTTYMDGWHVNASEDVPEWAAYKCDPQPTTPFRVYAGLTPVCYRFESEAEYLALIEDEPI